MDEDLRNKAIGHFDMTVAELPNLYSYWEFKANGKAWQDGKEMGEWYIKEGCVIVAYHHKPYGYACLSFDNDNLLLGENLWQEGKMFSWTLKRVNP